MWVYLYIKDPLQKENHDKIRGAAMARKSSKKKKKIILSALNLLRAWLDNRNLSILSYTTLLAPQPRHTNLSYTDIRPHTEINKQMNKECLDLCHLLHSSPPPQDHLQGAPQNTTMKHPPPSWCKNLKQTSSSSRRHNESSQYWTKI